MRQYVIKRILQAIPVLLGISVVTFLIIHSAPGDPFSSLINPKMRGEDLARMRRAWGLDQPLYMQYFKWLGQILRGNLGFSISWSLPVAEMLKTRLPPTFFMSLTSLLIGTSIAIPLGVISATKQYSLLDYILTVLAFAGLSIPAFFSALILVKVFALGLRWFPTQGLVTPAADFAFPWNYGDAVKHLLLPTITLSLLSIAQMMRYTRSSMLEVIQQDYIKTARSKGLTERVVVYKHALRNALIPVLTILGLSLPNLFSGAILTETVYSLPGMGLLGFSAVLERDYPVLMATTMLFAAMVVLGNFMADLAYAWADPRIRYD